MIAYVWRECAEAPTPQVIGGVDGQPTPVKLNEHELVWVDVREPQAEDIAWLKQTFGFHQLALEDVERRHQRPKLDEYPGYYFGVLYALRPQSGEHHVGTSELQFFWGPTYLVTIHTEPFPEIDDLATRARAGALAPVVQATDRPPTVADLVYRVIDAIVDGYFLAVDELAEWTEDVEERLFSSKRNSDMLQTIFELRSSLIQLRRVVAPSREVINVVLRRDLYLFGNEFQAYFQDTYDHAVRVIDSLDTYRELLGSALDTYLTSVSNDLSQTVRTMTALTAILMVNALIAGIYGMNFEHIPSLQWQFGFLWALALMAVASLVLWVSFRRARWL